ncbi:MAG: bifunctional glutamate N-acetyltransferase/amino-acid acetyltransferase ArgJ [PVC group bacterium]
MTTNEKIRRLEPPALPAGFLSAGAACGIKPDGGPDLAMIYSDAETAAAGSFTSSRVSAAPVKLSRTVVSRGRCRAVIANSGCANAATGDRGMRDAERMARLTTEVLGLDSGEVAVASTGRIGRFLPMGRIETGIRDLGAIIREGGNGDAARAVMTTDTVPKEIALELRVEGKVARLWGIAKGAGMIYPRMRVEGAPLATMLSFLATDLAAGPPLLRDALDRSLSRSFNRITVDGDTSTNDTVILMANGRSGAVIEAGAPSAGLFQEALDRLTRELAWMIVADGEGAGKFVEIDVRGALTADDARRAAEAVGNSLLFKCALHGETPNWGRLLAALGYSGAAVEEGRIAVSLGRVEVVRGGLLTEANDEMVSQELKKHRLSFRIDLGLGEGWDVCYTCDITPRYVEINKE